MIKENDCYWWNPKRRSGKCGYYGYDVCNQRESCKEYVGDLDD